MSEEWEIVDYYCYDCGIEEDGYEQKQKWWSNKIGWVMDAGKKLAITGFVISSAPVVLPPLLVVSALGFAMSVPFGVVFAAYASTHKLMTKLLAETAENIYQEQESIMRLESASSDTAAADEDRYDAVRDYSEQLHDGYDDQVGGEREGGGVEGDKNAEEEREINDDVESPDQETRTSSEGERENENIRIEASNLEEEEEEEEEEVRESDEIDSEKTEKQVILIDVDVETSGGGEVISSIDEPNKRIQLPAAAAPVVVADHDIGSKGEEEEEEEEEEREGNLINGDSPESVVLNGEPRHSDKELEVIGDEKIWEKINAVRVIVGFKAPKRSSYFEEVKALYLFTGIDPPSTSSDQHQLVDNLNFLMSVLGLK